ncbi:MAG: ATP-dependent DNA helicase [Lactobacillales bacterium]|jgi:ATP-dependent DNA helicase RecQ|nr:ATP-dependent DNA helicase [Lactobacillales bacterium]
MEDKLLMELKKHFGFTEFKTGQREIIESLLAGSDTLGILPTGTGKSLCYQLSGMLAEGSVLVVSPLLSLMEDQVRSLQVLGEHHVIALNSSLLHEEKYYVLKHLSSYKFIFASPEMLLQGEVLNYLRKTKFGLFVIDEAHCVSQWGMDFRPEYARLHVVQEVLNHPVTLALTATATPLVEQDIRQYLFPEGVECFRSSVNRENIGLVVRRTEKKEEQLIQLLKTLSPLGSGIVYASTRKETEFLARLITTQLGIDTAFYHGGLTASERGSLQAQFLNNELPLLCATNAFGMGIDKPDIRFVVHYSLSGSLESYVQEYGRAGRDGLPALAILFYKEGDEFIHQYFHQEQMADRQSLSFITGRSKEEIKDLLPLFKGIQQKWLQGFLEDEYTYEELVGKLLEKETQKNNQLQTMLIYQKSSSCRRNFIQTYFGDNKVNIPPEYCCDNCGLRVEEYIKQFPKVEKVEKSEQSAWQEIIHQLF